MSPSTSQEKKKNSIPEPFLTSPTSGLISFLDHEFTTEEATILRDRLTDLINCNVANLAKSNPFQLRETWWDTVKDPKVFTVQVDQTVFTDLQRLSKIGDNFEKTILELILFYSDRSALNIILEPDVMQSRTSYYKYTAQLAHSLARAQSLFPFVKVKTDTTPRLGIFCRKDSTGTPKKSFIENIISTLQKADNHTIYFAWEDLPKTYKSNFAMLKHQLRNLLPDQDIHINAKKSSPFINISISPAKLS